MPNPIIHLAALSPEELKRTRGLAAPKELQARFPKRAQPKLAAARSAMRDWQKSVAAPAIEENPLVPIRAVVPSRGEFTKLRNVAGAGLAPSAMAQEDAAPDHLFGVLFSGLATYEFMKLEAEYKRRKARRGPSLAATERRWKEIVSEFSGAFAAAGIPNVGESDLLQYVRELNANKANRDAIIEIAQSGVAQGAPRALTGRGLPVAAFVPVTGVVRDVAHTVTAIADLCDDPIAAGRFTKHFSYSISLSVRISYPCGISWSGIKWCTKKVTLAGVSFSFAVDVGYRVNCCGATVWGQGGARVCATIVGIEVCAQCTATIVGVAGVARTPVANGCSYGLGINATLKCTLAGATILNISYPFGWTVTGPCPPAGLCA